jgi:hypothetical protein
MTACISEEIIHPDNPVTNDDPTAVTVRISFPGTEQVATRALSTAAENEIDSLSVFVFRKSPTNNPLQDIYLYTVSIHKDSIHNSGSDPFNTKTVIVRLKQIPDTLQRLVLVANIPSGLNLSLTKDVSTEQNLIDQLKFSGAPWRTASGITYFPMWGQMDGGAADGYLEIEYATPPPSSPIEIHMIRSVAKIEVGMDIHGTGDPALGFGTVFWIDSVFVCNASDSGYIAPHRDYLNADLVEKINPISQRFSQTGYKFPIVPVSPSTAEDRTLSNTIYVPESDTLKNLDKPAFLVIKMRYYDESNYYRIDFAKNSQYIPLLRNHSYEINITGVRMKGYATLEEARNAPVSSMNYALTLDDADREINEVIATKDYMLGYASSDIRVDWRVDGPVVNSVSIPVKTDFPAGWKAVVTNNTNSLISSLATSSGSAGIVNNLTFSVAENTTGNVRTAEITLSAGILSKVLKITQSPGSNSYIATTGSSVRIPVRSANADGVSRINGNISSFQILRDNGTSSTQSANNNILQYTVANAACNEWVIAKDASGAILWTWHVWVVSSTDNLNDKGQSYNGFTFMDRNLGAASATTDGLFYQWGRPVGWRSNGSGMNYTASPSPATNPLATVLAHPDTFYTSSAYPYDWIGTSPNNNLWNTASGEKAPYDPCPFGWRVPPVANDDSTSPWYNFTNGQNGLRFPIAGGLNGSTGQHQSAVSGVWGASARSINAYLFKVTSLSGSGSASSARRIDAYPVRCVKDVKRPW